MFSWVKTDANTIACCEEYKKLFKEIGQMGSPVQVVSRVVRFIKKLKDQSEVSDLICNLGAS